MITKIKTFMNDKEYNFLKLEEMDYTNQVVILLCDSQSFYFVVEVDLLEKREYSELTSSIWKMSTTIGEGQEPAVPSTPNKLTGWTNRIVADDGLSRDEPTGDSRPPSLRHSSRPTTGYPSHTLTRHHRRQPPCTTMTTRS